MDLRIKVTITIQQLLPFHNIFLQLFYVDISPKYSNDSIMVAAPSSVLTGIVKAVLSGDTLVVMKQASAVNGPPPEMRLTLSNLKAPLLSRDGLSDEPYAWASRQYLRSKLIGRPVSFRIDYRVQAVSRIFATIFEQNAEKSVNVSIVEEGLARVRQPSGQDDVSPEFEFLLQAEEHAAASQKGLHSGTGALSVRKLPQADASLVEGSDLVSAIAGRPLEGIVEYVATGSVFKIFLQNVPTKSISEYGDRVITVCLTGIQCPGFRRAEGDDPSAPPKAMPFAANARFLSEIRLLNRDVRVSLEGVDRNGMIFATVEDVRAKTYIGEELLLAGLAKTVSWGLDRCARAPALRAAERAARDAQAGLWKGFRAAPGKQEAFTGKVIEVVSGDMLAILDDSTGDVRRINLASVRASRAERPASRDRNTMPTGPAADAKEALRKKLIGRRVSVKVEYTREPGPEAVRKEVMTFATVKREGDVKNSDVALGLISNGLLAVVRHRGEEDRGENYEEYLEREAEATDAKRGIHGGAVNGGVRINNLTGPDAKKRSRDVVNGLQRGGARKGIVEYVTSASRYRVYLTSESMLITLALRAVRCPQSTRKTYGPDGSIREEVPGEPHGDEAADFARERFMQREVEVEVMSVDRVGAFLGNMVVVSPSGERTDVSELLLSTGHGFIHESFDASRDRGGSRYAALEREARDSKKGLWVDYVEQSKHSEGEGEAVVPSTVKRRFVGTVCEIGFGGRIFVQDSKSSKSTLSAVENGLAAMGLDNVGEIPLATVKPGSVIAAKFSADGRWYRAKVLYVHKNEGVDVRFIDYGNEEHVPGKDLRQLGVAGSLSAPPVATEVMLANVVVPDEDDLNGMAAGEWLREMVFGREVEVAVMTSEGNSKVVGDILISESKDANGAGSSTDTSGARKISLRRKMLESGLARIVRKKDKASREAFKELRPFEEVGVKSRQFLWMYGDAYESDYDEEQGDKS